MAQLLERIDSYKSLAGQNGDIVLWSPAAGEKGILCFLWVHSMAVASGMTIIVKTSTIDFLKLENDATNPVLPQGGVGILVLDSTDNFDRSHVGQFKFPIEGAVDDSNDLLVNKSGSTGQNFVYSLAVVKEV